MAPMPTVPSLPPPESTTPIACSPLSSASEYRSASTRLGTGPAPERRQHEPPLLDCQRGAGGTDHDWARRLAIAGNRYRHGAVAAEDVGKRRLVAKREMRDQHEGHAAVRRRNPGTGLPEVQRRLRRRRYRRWGTVGEAWEPL